MTWMEKTVTDVFHLKNFRPENQKSKETFRRIFFFVTKTFSVVHLAVVIVADVVVVIYCSRSLLAFNNLIQQF